MSTARARRWPAGVALLAAALGAAVVAPHLHHHLLRTGDRLVAFRVDSVSGGEYTVAPGARPTIINVFATWCPPCREETPGFAATARRLQARGIRVVAIDQRESAPAVARFAKAFALPYPVYIDTTGVTHDLLGARVIPTTIIVNSKGVIVWEHAGPLTPDQLLAAVSRSGQENT